MLSSFASRKTDKDATPVTPQSQPNTIPQSAHRQSSEGPRPPRAAVSRHVERAASSVIGPNLTIMGNLVSNGEVQIDGEVQGDVHATHVVIGENARITGGIMAEEVVVRGRVEGFLRGNRVMLQATSHVEGDVHHKSLAIEQGAYFEGKSRRTENPLAETTPVQQRPAAYAPEPVHQAAPPDNDEAAEQASS